MRHLQAAPIVLVFGPSGVGKSTFAAFLATRAWLHVEIDQFTASDGVNRLRAPWDTFCAMRNAWPLHQELQERMRRADAKGCVVTFPSGTVPPLDLIRAAERASMKVACLHGGLTDCLATFLHREAETGRNLGRAYWFARNLRCHCQFGQFEYAPYRVATYKENGQRRANTEVLAQILARGEPHRRTALQQSA